MNFSKFLFYVFFSCYINDMYASKVDIIPFDDLPPEIACQKVTVHPSITLNFYPFPLSASELGGADDHEQLMQLPETSVLSILKGRVYSDIGYVLVQCPKRLCLLEESLWGNGNVRNKQKQIFQKYCELNEYSEVKKIQGKIIVLAQWAQENYYHWMTEVLPKLSLLEQSKTEYDWLCFPKLDRPFQRATLILLGIDPQKILEADKDMYIEADELIVPSSVSQVCYTPEWVIKFLQEKILPKVRDQSSPEYIFISREKALQRRFANEGALFSALEKLGFKKIFLEDYTVLEQIGLFHHARTIVAAHGAGLTNMLFCAPKTHVVELFQAHKDLTYFRLSQTLGLRYDCLKTTFFKENGGYTDTVISPQSIDALIELLEKSFNQQK